MALKFFEEPSSNNTQLPFVEDFVKANPKLKQLQYEITEVRKTRKGTGYLFICSHFSFFRYGNDKTCRQILDALKVYSSKANGYALFCILTKKEDPIYGIAVDFEQKRTWYEGNGGYSLDASFLIMSQDNGENPFLPIAP